MTVCELKEERKKIESRVDVAMNRDPSFICKLDGYGYGLCVDPEHPEIFGVSIEDDGTPKAAGISKSYLRYLSLINAPDPEALIAKVFPFNPFFPQGANGWGESELALSYKALLDVNLRIYECDT